MLSVGEPIAERAILEVTGGVSCYSAWDIERIADQVTERAVDRSPQGLAAECGVPIVLEPLLPAAVPLRAVEAMRRGELHAPFAHLPAWAVALRFEMPTVQLAA